MTDSQDIPGLVERLNVLRRFLSGQGEIDGLSFGDAKRGVGGRAIKYWWRREHLVAVAEAAQALTALSTRLEEVERERDEAREVSDIHRKYGEDVAGWRDRYLARAEAAESQLQALIAERDAAVAGWERVTEDPVGAAERDVGRWVYERISKLMDTKEGAPEEAELRWLAACVETIEEYGSIHCAGEELAPFPTPSEALLAERREMVETLKDARAGVSIWIGDLDGGGKPTVHSLQGVGLVIDAALSKFSTTGGEG